MTAHRPPPPARDASANGSAPVFGELVDAVARAPDDPARDALVARAPDDPRRSAELAVARRLDRWLTEASPDAHPAPAPAPDVLARIEAQVVDRLAADRAAGAPLGLGRWTGWMPALAAAAIWVLMAGRHLHAGTDPVQAAGSLGLAGIGIAALAVGVAFARGRVGNVVLATVLGASAAFALVASSGLGPLVGAKCGAVELGASAVPLGLVGMLYAYRGLRPGPLRFAIVGAAGALTAQAAVELGCPAGSGAVHMLAFHVGGVAVAALVGALASQLVPRPASAR